MSDRKAPTPCPPGTVKPDPPPAPPPEGQSSPLTVEISPEPGRMTVMSPMLVTREERLTVLRKRQGLSLGDLVKLLETQGVYVSLSGVSFALVGAPKQCIGKARREAVLSACEIILSGELDKDDLPPDYPPMEDCEGLGDVCSGDNDEGLEDR